MANWELATCLLCLCGHGTSSLLTFISGHISLPFLDTHLHWQLPVRVEFEPTAGAAHSQGLLLLGRQSRTEHRAQSCFKFIFMLPLGAVYRDLSDFIRSNQATPPVGHSRMPPTNDRQTDRRTDLNCNRNRSRASSITISIIDRRSLVSGLWSRVSLVGLWSLDVPFA